MKIIPAIALIVGLLPAALHAQAAEQKEPRFSCPVSIAEVFNGAGWKVPGGSAKVLRTRTEKIQGLSVAAELLESAEDKATILFPDAGKDNREDFIEDAKVRTRSFERLKVNGHVFAYAGVLEVASIGSTYAFEFYDIDGDGFYKVMRLLPAHSNDGLFIPEWVKQSEVPVGQHQPPSHCPAIVTEVFNEAGWKVPGANAAVQDSATHKIDGVDVAIETLEPVDDTARIFFSDSHIPAREHFYDGMVVHVGPAARYKRNGRVFAYVDFIAGVSIGSAYDFEYYDPDGSGKFKVMRVISPKEPDNAWDIVIPDWVKDLKK